MSVKPAPGTMISYNGKTWEVRSSYETISPSGRSEIWFYTTESNYYEPFRLSSAKVIGMVKPTPTFMELFI